MAGIGRKSRQRGKHRKNKNRHNPSAPNWLAVHRPWSFLSGSPLLMTTKAK